MQRQSTISINKHVQTRRVLDLNKHKINPTQHLMLVALDAVSGTRCMLSNVVSAKKKVCNDWEARSKAVKSSVCVRRKL